MAESIFNQPHFQDPEAAREYLESIRWANGVVCNAIDGYLLAAQQGRHYNESASDGT